MSHVVASLLWEYMSATAGAKALPAKAGATAPAIRWICRRSFAALSRVRIRVKPTRR